MDVLIGLFVASILTVAFLGSVVSAVRYANLQTKEVQAELLAIELVEIARELEDSRWSELTSSTCATAGSECYPSDQVVSGAWRLVSGEETIGAFTRSMYTEPVTRDASHAIASSGTVDPHTRKVVATVSWNAYGTPRTLTLETYVYDNV